MTPAAAAAGTQLIAASVVEDLEPLGPVSGAPFFGGVGLKLRGTQFAVVMDGQLYLRVDDRSRPYLEQLGGAPFEYRTARGTVTVRAYYRLPDSARRDPQQLGQWARRALETALAHSTTSR